jgi:tetratricopeptide (TPR) repeat protein
MMWFPPTRRHPGFRPIFVVLCTLCFLFGFAANAQLVQRLCTVTVSVRSADGSPSDIQATVSLYYFASGSPLYTATPRAGQVTFRGLAPARYSVEVTAPGYQTVTQPVDLQLGGESEQVYVGLTPQFAPQALSTSAIPVLAPKAQKELARVLEDLRSNHNEDAQRRLEKVSRTAPSYPDVDYLWGAYYAQIQDRPRAKEYWLRTLKDDPRHVFALAALSQLASHEGDLPAAIGYLERAVDAQPSSWSYQQRLAAAYLQHQEPDKAEKCAIRATQLGKEHAADSQLILAQIAARRSDRDQAIKAFEAYLAAVPDSPRAQQVRQWIASLRKPTSAIAPATPSDVTPISISLPAAPTNAPLRIADLVPPPKWLPTDVDDNMPPVEHDVACPMERIRLETGKRVREFISAANRISATEYLDNEVIDDSGLPKRRESRRYNYVVTVSQISPELFNVEEYRSGSPEVDDFPEHVATLGLPAIVLVFDPAFRDDYEVSCEGLSRSHAGLSGLTWQVHFRQKADTPGRIRGYRIGRASYPLSLRGRAWIATDSFQVAGLETDIVAPIPAIRLKVDHDFIEYAPVKFSKSSQELWLPASAEVFLDFHGHRMHRRHYFRNYVLFSVDEKQTISDPKPTLESNSTDSPQ